MTPHNSGAIARFIPGSAGDTDADESLEPDISPSRKRRLEAFCMEYARDLNARAAALRIGISKSTAASFGSNALREPYFQKIWAKRVDESAKRTDITLDRILAGLWREANHVGFDASHGARVKALTKLADIYQPEPQPGAGTGQAIAVMVVPMSSSPDTWEAEAIAHQTALKSASRN